MPSLINVICSCPSALISSCSAHSHPRPLPDIWSFDADVDDNSIPTTVITPALPSMSSGWEPADPVDTGWNTQDDPSLQQGDGDAWPSDPPQGMSDPCCAFGTHDYSRYKES